MHNLIADAVTNPAKVIELPLIIFRQSMTFGLAMMQQASDFVQGLFRILV